MAAATGIGHFTLVLFLLALSKTRGGPAYNPVPASDLSDLKGLLERLEDRLQPEEAEVPPQDAFAPNYDSSESGPSWPGEGVRPAGDMYSRGGPWTQQEKAAQLRSKLRDLLSAPRSMRRSSDCFGSRIDRIGAQSGMGCGRKFYRDVQDAE